MRLKPVPHLSLDDKKHTVLDEVDALLLRRVSETDSLTEAAKLLGISYRNAWGRIRKIESGFGKQVLDTRIGGPAGGSSRLTPEGMSLLSEFRNTRKYLFNALDDKESAGKEDYKLSARNRVYARILRIEKDGITALIKMQTKAPVTLTSIISKDALKDLELRKGDEVVATIKSTDVMVSRPVPPASNRRTKTGR